MKISDEKTVDSLCLFSEFESSSILWSRFSAIADVGFSPWADYGEMISMCIMSEDEGLKAYEKMSGSDKSAFSILKGFLEYYFLGEFNILDDIVGTPKGKILKYKELAYAHEDILGPDLNWEEKQTMKN